MSAISSRAQDVCPWLAAVLLALPAMVRAQDPLPTPTPTPDPLAGVSVQVLDQQQVTIGTHTITYKRIAPPVLPGTTPALKQAPPVARGSRSAQNADASAGEKSSKGLLLSATVYDHQFTELRWDDGSAPILRAYVNIDFAYFTTVTTLETADTVYSLFFAWGNDTVASITQAGRQPPNLAAFPVGRSSYQIIAGDANANPDAVAALNALCAYYDANGAQMVATYAQQQADNAAHQQWVKDHPPAQPNTVIYYWPTKGSAYLRQAN